MTTTEIITTGYAAFLTAALCGYAIWACRYVAKFERQAKFWEASTGDALDAASHWYREFEALKARAYVRDAKGRIAKAADVLP